MSNKYFVNPFAINGNKEAIPDKHGAQENQVNYNEGYTEAYEKDPIKENGRNIERTHFNQLMYDITSNLKFLQERGLPEWISNDGSGKPFAYPINSFVNRLGKPYYNTVDKNTKEPESKDSGWSVMTFGGESAQWLQNTFPLWKKGTIYPLEAVVRYDNGTEISTYYSTIKNNKSEPTKDSNWKETQFGGGDVGEWEKGTFPDSKLRIEYKKNAIVRDTTSGEMWLSTKDSNLYIGTETWKKINLEILTGGGVSSIPSGVPLPYPSDVPPKGYLVMKGQSITESKYPVLFGLYGGTLPDMRGRYLKGAGLGSEALTKQDGRVMSHEHPTVTVNTQEHNHGKGKYKIEGILRSPVMGVWNRAGTGAIRASGRDYMGQATGDKNKMGGLQLNTDFEYDEGSTHHPSWTGRSESLTLSVKVNTPYNLDSGGQKIGTNEVNNYAYLWIVKAE